MQRTSVALFLSALSLAAGTTACSPSQGPGGEQGGETPKQELEAPAAPASKPDGQAGEGGEGGEG